MAINIPRGGSDQVLERIKAEALQPYQNDHPGADIQLYRQNSVSVRVRIIDPDFAGQDKPTRNRVAWKYLERLPDDVQSDISMLLLLTPDETKSSSLANLEFDDPIPSNL